MTTICIYTDSNLIHARLDEIANRIPCIAKYNAETQEASVMCRQEDAPWVESMLADLV